MSKSDVANRYFRSPEALLGELGIESPKDILVEAIAQHCGATVVYEPLVGSEARLIGFGERAIITVSSESPVPRRRFSVAHELGHWMHDRGRVGLCCGDSQLNSENSSDKIERRANRYAVDLLLPKKLFLPRVLGAEPTLSNIRELALEFGTSFTATAIRCLEFSKNPALLVCSEKNSRRWYFRSQGISSSVQLRRKLDPRALAHQLINNLDGEELSGEIPADAWLVSGFSGLKVREQCFKGETDYVISIITIV